MHVRVSDDARTDLHRIKDYLEPRNARASERMITAILTAAYQLGDFPFLGRIGREPDTRELSVPRTPFIIVYTLPDAYHVDIERVLHDRQLWPPE